MSVCRLCPCFVRKRLVPALDIVVAAFTTSVSFLVCVPFSFLFVAQNIFLRSFSFFLKFILQSFVVRFVLGENLLRFPLYFLLKIFLVSF